MGREHVSQEAFERDYRWMLRPAVGRPAPPSPQRCGGVHRKEPAPERARIEHHHLRGPHRIAQVQDRKSTRLNSSHVSISYAVFCLKKNIYVTYTEASKP